MDGWALAANLSTLLASIVAVAGLWLAARAARDQRRNRDFPSDKAYADEFDRRAGALHGGQVLGYDRRTAADVLNAAVADYGPAHRSDRRGEVRSMMGRHTQRAEAILRANPTAPLTFEEQAEVSRLIDRARRIAEDWAYPERRRATMTDEYHIQYRETIEAGGGFDYNEAIQLRRWLLTGHPSESRTAQTLRVVGVWLERLWFDVRRRRVLARLRSWREERRIGRQEMAAYLATLRPAAPSDAVSSPSAARADRRRT